MTSQMIPQPSLDELLAAILLQLQKVNQTRPSASSRKALADFLAILAKHQASIQLHKTVEEHFNRAF